MKDWEVTLVSTCVGAGSGDGVVEALEGEEEGGSTRGILSVLNSVPNSCHPISILRARRGRGNSRK
jgi:hypothetical protein